MSLRHLRLLFDSHSGPTAAAPSRAGSIISAERPCVRIIGGAVNGLGQVQGFTPAELAQAEAVGLAAAPSVGCVKVQRSDGVWVKVGTAFRVAGGPRRMMSARHVLAALLRPGTGIVSARPFQPSVPLRPAAVSFHDDAEGAQFGISEILWAHPKWDMMVFDLDADPPCPALVLETDPAWGQPDENGICIVSYPIQPSQADQTLSATVIGAPLGVKRLSVGRATCRPATLPVPTNIKAALLSDEHDATTLHGSSGAPVLDIASGRVVGLHFHGRNLHTDLMGNRNFSVSAAVALAEPHLNGMVHDPALDLAGVAEIVWQPKKVVIAPASETELGSIGEESVFPDDHSPALSVVIPDPPDFRDLPYQPALLVARHEVIPAPEDLPPPADQKGEPSCVGFALATAIEIELLRLKQSRPVSARMLYEMARMSDEWADDASAGTSLRGGIKGFFHNGVCSAETAPYRPGEIDWPFTISAAKEARGTTLGAYYRLRPSITDFQAALGEVGAIVVSAHVHKGWVRGKRPVTQIPFRTGRIGTHAFTLVGYTPEGFLVQNSWGPEWAAWKGRKGVALWTYSDWGENLIDAWVLRLAPSAPNAFNVVPRAFRDETTQAGSPSPVPHLPVPRRNKLVGHVANLERDGLSGAGRTGTGLASLRETALYLGSDKGAAKYPTILFVAHDPLMGLETFARVAGHIVDPLKAAGIYPVHLLYGQDEIDTLRLRVMHEAQMARQRLAGSGQNVDAFLDQRVRRSCSGLVERFRAGAKAAAEEGGPLWQAITTILIEAGPRRHCALLSVGMGSLVADAAMAMPRHAEMPPFPTLDLRLSPVSAASAKFGATWTLERPERPDPALCGYNGGWTSLATRLCACEPVEAQPRADVLRTSTDTLAAALASPEFLSVLKRRLGGRARVPAQKT